MWQEYVAGKGLNETVSAFLGEMPRRCTGADHLFIHTRGCYGEFLNWGFTKVFDLLVALGSLRRITWCVFIKGHSYHLCHATARATYPKNRGGGGAGPVGVN